MSLLMTWRMRHVPASGAKVRPVRRAFWICAAMPTVKASTRSDGSDTDTRRGRCSRVGDGVADDVLDAAEVGGGQRRERHLVVAGAAQALVDHAPDLLGRALAHGPGDHARLAEPAAPGAAPEDLDVEPVVDDLGERHELVLGVRPVGEVGDGALLDLGRHVGVAGLDRHQVGARRR